MSRLISALLLFSLLLCLAGGLSAQDTSLDGAARALRAAAIAAMTGGDYPGAIDLFREFNEKYPGRYVAMMYLGKCYLAEGMFDEAIVHLEGALLIRPADYQLTEMLGQARPSRCGIRS